jgi:signal transduction histidine kinase
MTVVGGAAPYPWPLWPLLGFVAIAGGYSVLALGTSASGRATLAARIDALTRSRERAADAEAAELRRIERDLHDGAQARLVALSMQLGRAELALEDRPGARQLVADAHHEARRAIADLRSLARGIAPPLLSDRGLPAAARELAGRCGAELEAEPALETRRLAPALERGAYFVIAEGLANAAKHASAEHISVRLALSGGELVVAVADDGRGGADPAGSGLGGLRDRVEALGGTLALASTRGDGTTLEARFPTGS